MDVRDWWGKPPYWGPPERQRVVQVDCDEEMLGLNRPVELAVLADLRVFLEQLLAELKGRELTGQAARQARLDAWARRVAELRAFLRAIPGPEDASPLHSALVPLVCRELFDDDAILVIDCGNTAVWTNLYHENRTPGALLGTFKFGMLRAGPGQALGAKVAFPDRQVYCILGNGAMGFHPQELDTAVRHRLRVVFFVLCDRQWGMVKMSQSMALDAETMLAKRSLPPGRTLGTDFEEIRFDDNLFSLLVKGAGLYDVNPASLSQRRIGIAATLRDVKPGVDKKPDKSPPGLRSGRPVTLIDSKQPPPKNKRHLWNAAISCAFAPLPAPQAHSGPALPPLPSPMRGRAVTPARN